MQISQKGIELIKKWEGVRLKAYKDSVGTWTIGYGHTFGVKQGDSCSHFQAEKWLNEESKSHMTVAVKLIAVDISQNMYDALASFHYNLGKNILVDSNLLKLINQKKWNEAGAKMKEYNKGGGKVLKGLVNRRNDEVKLFLNGADKIEAKKRYVFGSRNLRLAKPMMNGADVMVLQKALIERGFYPDKDKEDKGLDGWYGVDTDDAFRRWQSVYVPRSVDGIFGSNSKRILGKQVN